MPDDTDYSAMTAKFSLKKQPVQPRSQLTVESITEAAVQILRQEGRAGFTTNHVAERAGVSIGTLYQYFADKDVLIAEIKRQHFHALRQLIRDAYMQHQAAPLAEIVAAFVRASIAAHRIDPQLHRVLSEEFSGFDFSEDEHEDGPAGHKVRQQVEALLEQHRASLRPGIDIPLAARICYGLVENSTHGAVIHGALAGDGEMLVRELQLAIMAYLLPPPETRG